MGSIVFIVWGDGEGACFGEGEGAHFGEGKGAHVGEGESMWVRVHVHVGEGEARAVVRASGSTLGWEYI